ncbi:MAG: hypothetical protein Q9227_003934 [Pyrenula ochraceoflavens]
MADKSNEPFNPRLDLQVSSARREAQTSSQYGLGAANARHSRAVVGPAETQVQYSQDNQEWWNAMQEDEDRRILEELSRLSPTPPNDDPNNPGPEFNPQTDPAQGQNQDQDRLILEELSRLSPTPPNDYSNSPGLDMDPQPNRAQDQDQDRLILEELSRLSPTPPNDYPSSPGPKFNPQTDPAQGQDQDQDQLILEELSRLSPTPPNDDPDNPEPGLNSRMDMENIKACTSPPVWSCHFCDSPEKFARLDHYETHILHEHGHVDDENTVSYLRQCATEVNAWAEHQGIALDPSTQEVVRRIFLPGFSLSLM